MEDIKRDYNNKVLFKEDSLKNAFYYHLRSRLGDTFLTANDLCIYTEFYLNTGQKVDLVIAEVDFEKARNEHLRNCIKNLVVVIEFKYTNSVDDKPYVKDIDKLIKYIKNLPYVDTHYYAAFIREIEYLEECSSSWIEDEHKIKINKNLTELLASYVKGEMTWEVINH